MQKLALTDEAATCMAACSVFNLDLVEIEDSAQLPAVKCYNTDHNLQASINLPTQYIARIANNVRIMQHSKFGSNLE